MGTHSLYEVKVLMLLKNNKEQFLFMQNDHKESIIYGYLNPPGGHIEPGEFINETVIREVEEETGIVGISDVKVRGIVNVIGFKDVPILMIVVTGDVALDAAITVKTEGTPLWVKREELKNFKLLKDVEKLLDLEANTPENEFFHVSCAFANRELVEFKVL